MTTFKVTVEPEEQPSQIQQQTAPVKASNRNKRLPNPSITKREYDLVGAYTRQFDNMTLQDFVELAIIEKLHNDAGYPQTEFNARYEEIRNRLPRGHRKGTINNK